MKDDVRKNSETEKKWNLSIILLLTWKITKKIIPNVFISLVRDEKKKNKINSRDTLLSSRMSYSASEIRHYSQLLSFHCERERRVKCLRISTTYVINYVIISVREIIKGKVLCYIFYWEYMRFKWSDWWIIRKSAHFPLFFFFSDILISKWSHLNSFLVNIIDSVTDSTYMNLLLSVEIRSPIKAVPFTWKFWHRL